MNGDGIKSSTKYLLVTPSRRTNEWKNKTVPFQELSALALLLETLGNGIVALAGRPQNANIKMYCNMTQVGWTIVLSSRIKQNTMKNGGTCFICDLLPDTFLVRATTFKNFTANKTETQFYKRVGESVHLLFFLAIKGKSAYCPDFDMRNLSSNQDYTCNRLGSRWDHKFRLVPKYFNLRRIYVEDEDIEVWLVCVFSFTSVNKDLPIACSNFMMRYLVDITDTVTRKLRMKYHILYGTALGRHLISFCMHILEKQPVRFTGLLSHNSNRLL